MVRINDIQDAFEHLIGWEQNYNPLEMSIDSSLTETESGLFFQQVHPLLTLQNLTSVAPDFENTHFPSYSGTASYKKGDVVRSSGVYYRAVAASTGEPLDSTTYWTTFDPFSEWLRHKTRASIAKAVLRFVNDKLNKGTHKALFEKKTLFDGTGRIVDTEPNRNNLCGLELVPIRAKGILTRINRIGLQFTKAGNYTVYIMHSSKPDPYAVMNLVKESGNTMEWFDLDGGCLLPYSAQGIDAGGSWYVCYSQSDLPEGSMAIKKDRDWSKGPCPACSRSEYASWTLWSQFFEVHPFHVGAEWVPFDDGVPSMWDVEDNMYVFDSNYGINLDITVECDITDTLIEQRRSFQDVILKQVGVDFLRELAYNANARANRSIINASKTEILYELDGDSASMKKSGLNYQLDEAFKSVELTFEGIDRACLPCRNNGIKYRGI